MTVARLLRELTEGLDNRVITLDTTVGVLAETSDGFNNFEVDHCDTQGYRNDWLILRTFNGLREA